MSRYLLTQDQHEAVQLLRQADLKLRIMYIELKGRTVRTKISKARRVLENAEHHIHQNAYEIETASRRLFEAITEASKETKQQEVK